MDVYVDGVKVGSIDQNNSLGGWQTSWTSDLFPAGDHSLRLVYASGGFTNIDAIEVMANPVMLSTGVYDDANTAFSYTGSWYNMTGVTGPYSDTLHYSYGIGESFQVNFTGRQFKLSYLATPATGLMDVYVDGVKVGSIDQNNSLGGWQTSWTSDLFPAGDHSLRLVYASGGFTNIDAIEVMANPVMLSTGVYDDANTAFSYTGSWYNMTGVTGPYSDTLHYSYGIGESSQVNFTGRQFKLSYLATPATGLMDVYVDGVKVGSIDQNNSLGGWQTSWTSDLFPAGDHSLRLVYASGGFTNIDAIEVMANPVMLSTGVYDDANTAFSYTGSWYNMTEVTGPYSDTLHYSYGIGEILPSQLYRPTIQTVLLSDPCDRSHGCLCGWS